MELTKAGLTVPDLTKARTKASHNIMAKANPSDSKRYHRKKATYGYLKQHFKITKFILQSGHKLRLPPVAIASACVLYHRFWKLYLQLGDGARKQDFEPYMLGTTVLYMASKAEESPHKLRDVINVCHRSLHKNTFLDVGSEYWELRDSLFNCELFLLRVLGFRVSTENPHKYLLHYLKSLQDWVEPDVWRISNISQITWSILCDSIHIPLVLDHPPSHIAIAIIFFGVLCTGMQIPSQGARKTWWEAMCDTTNIDEVQEIIGDLMDLYDYESKPLL